MIKLSDAVLADIKANACNGGMSIEDAIRAFYDAQIDKQAKTMEELWDIFESYKRSKEAGAWAYAKHPESIEHDYDEYFSEAIGFYLAAGGTIKE